MALSVIPFPFRYLLTPSASLPLCDPTVRLALLGFLGLGTAAFAKCFLEVMQSSNCEDNLTVRGIALMFHEQSSESCNPMLILT